MLKLRNSRMWGACAGESWAAWASRAAAPCARCTARCCSSMIPWGVKWIFFGNKYSSYDPMLSKGFALQSSEWSRPATIAETQGGKVIEMNTPCQKQSEVEDYSAQCPNVLMAGTDARSPHFSLHMRWHCHHLQHFSVGTDPSCPRPHLHWEGCSLPWPR